VLSLVPGDLRPHTEAPGYLEHVAAYFITAILLSLGYLRWSPIVIIAPLSIYAASLEIAQLYIPGRNSSVWDWFAGSSGALMGVVVATFVLRLWRRSPDTHWRS
jgi:VanZ family protein